MQSDEVASGQFFNDTFDVRIDDLTTNQFIHDSETVGTLRAAGQWDSNAATPWYTLQLPVTEGHLIRVTLTVQHAIDNAYGSWIFVDNVSQDAVRIVTFDLRDMSDPQDSYASAREDKPIGYLSSSTYDSYEGYVRLNGFLGVTGPANDSIQSMTLAIYDGNNNLVTRASLARASVSNVISSIIGVPFGTTGVSVGLDSNGQELGITPLLFEVSSSALNTLAQNTEDTNIRATLEVTTATGVNRTFDVPRRLIKLVRYLGTNRFGDRDQTDCVGLSGTARLLRNRPPFPCGRDDWARPKVVSWVSQATVSVNWNDFSNLDGGQFPIHAGHRNGDTADGVFAGYTNRDAAAAQRTIAFLNDRSAHGEVQRVLVGYSTRNYPIGQDGCSAPVKVACGYVDNRPATLSANAFYQAISNVVLGDGRQASAVIQNATGHCDHFDVRFNIGALPDPR
jgi:hypothetical protein